MLRRMEGKRASNFLLRQARQARRETQEQTAQTVGELLDHPVDPEYIGRLERGVVSWPNAGHRSAFRTHFGVASDAELGFYCRRSESSLREADDVRRRAFLSALPLAAMPGTEPLAALVSLANDEPTPMPRRVGLEQVEQVRAVVTQVDQLSHRFGGGVVREMLGAQMRWAVDLLDAHVDRAASDELHSVIGDLAAYAGWSSHDVGADTAAQRYYQVALRCAEQADDWNLRAEAVSDMARIAQYGGDGETALTLSQQAQVRADRLTPLRRACLAAVEAGAHGQRGDANACLAAVGRAEDHFAAADPANETPGMVAFYSSAQLAGDSGHALWPLALRGQHVHTAADRLRRATDSYPVGYARSRTLGLTRLASLTFAQGDPAEAVGVATDALDGTGSVQSHRVADNLIALRRVARRHRGVPGVAPLRQRITRTLAAV